jgi:hypothetical protein
MMNGIAAWRLPEVTMGSVTDEVSASTAAGDEKLSRASRLMRPIFEKV